MSDVYVEAATKIFHYPMVELLGYFIIISR